LPRELILQVLNRLLIDLGQDPSQHLGPPVPPIANAFELAFVLTDSHNFPPLHLFNFVVYRDDAKQVLRIVSARHSTENPGTN